MRGDVVQLTELAEPFQRDRAFTALVPGNRRRLESAFAEGLYLPEGKLAGTARAPQRPTRLEGEAPHAVPSSPSVDNGPGGKALSVGGNNLRIHHQNPSPESRGVPYLRYRWVFRFPPFDTARGHVGRPPQMTP